MDGDKKLFNIRYQSGCILCGRMDVKRFKMLDERNYPVEVCVDCLMKEVKDVRIDEGKKPKGSGKGKPSVKGAKQEGNGKEPKTGKEPATDVEGKPASG